VNDCFFQVHTQGIEVTVTNSPTFSRLVDMDQIQQLLEAQHRIHGTSSAIIDENENILVAVAWQDICTRFHRVHPESCLRCRESDAFIKSHLPCSNGEFLEYKCKNGLWDVAMPIKISGEHVATFFISQFFYDDDKRDPGYFRAQAAEFGFDEQDYLQAVGRVPVRSREQIRKLIEYSRNLVQMMAELGLKNLKLAQEVEERKKAEQEASFFRILIEYTRDPVYALSPGDGYRMAYANQAACSHFGKSLEELLAMRVPDWDPVFDMEHMDAVLEQLKQGTSMLFETIHRTASGRLVPVEVTSTYLEHNGQGLTVGHFHDITERKRIEEQILRLNRLYAVLSETNKAIAHSADRSTLFDEICRVVVEHGGFRFAWIGLADEETAAVRSVAWSSMDESYLENIMVSVGEEPEKIGPDASVIHNGKLKIINDFMNDPATAPWHGEAERRGYQSAAAIALKLNGEVIGNLTIYATEKLYFHGGMAGLLLQLANDISFALDNLDRESRRKEVERALQEETLQRLRTMEELREKERLLVLQNRQAAMGEMIENIAHQWRQPINTLGLILQELPLTHAVGELSREYLDDTVDRAMDQIIHMSQTINDFRDFFKPDKEKQTFSLRQVLARTLSLIEGSFRRPNISVEIDVVDEPAVTGHPHEYAQVLLNVLLNARDAFLERKIERPKVRIQLRPENGRSVMTIADNAGGIPDDVVGRVFEPYVTTKGPDRGTGVGLYMSKAIIEKNMNGSLSVRNTGEGAEFRIEV
jgi:PAS domain S-box-containing protein